MSSKGTALEAIREAISRLSLGREVDGELAGTVADDILNGEATPAQIGAFLTALSIRGEKPEHLIAFARKLREHASPVYIDNARELVDTCGTGGDRSGTFNISTAAALIAAGAGARVAKHGNRGITSGCGSADVLAALGVKIDASPETTARCEAETGVAFFFAPIFHQAMRHVGPARKEIGIRTIFNMLGPLANPAGARRQLIGVYAPELTEVFAKVLLELGSVHVMVVHGEDGLDEITTTAATRVTEARAGGEMKTYSITPEEFGLKRVRHEAIAGDGDAEANAEIVRAVLAGKDEARCEIACLNAAAALKVAGKAESIEQGLEKAREAVASGKAGETLFRLVEISNADQ